MTIPITSPQDGLVASYEDLARRTPGGTAVELKVVHKTAKLRNPLGPIVIVAMRESDGNLLAQLTMTLE